MVHGLSGPRVSMLPVAVERGSTTRTAFVLPAWCVFGFHPSATVSGCGLDRWHAGRVHTIIARCLAQSTFYVEMAIKGPRGVLASWPSARLPYLWETASLPGSGVSCATGTVPVSTDTRLLSMAQSSDDSTMTESPKGQCGRGRGNWSPPAHP